MATDELSDVSWAVRLPTAPVAALGLIAGFALAAWTGSRPLGGVVLAGCGLVCIAAWRQRDGLATTIWLTVAGLSAFALSHALGPVIGAWPAVLVVSAATAGLYWRVSDSRRQGASQTRGVRPPTSGRER